MEVALNPEEDVLFSKLSMVASTRGCILRVAGGWVRDKIGGKMPNDIDVMVDNMSGMEFARLLDSALPDEVSGLSCIEADPSFHKDLSTATIKLGCVPLEFTSFRTVDSCALPSDCVHPAGQDAYGRDFTINSLFYNIHTGEIEDWTGMGIEDVTAGRIRCPLSADTTLLADPLRILRAARFAAQLNFRVDPSISRECRENAELRQALAMEIKRQRIQVELMKILSGLHPVEGMRLLQAFDVIGIVFLPMASFQDIWSEPIGAAALSVMEQIYSAFLGTSSCHLISNLLEIMQLRPNSLLDNPGSLPSILLAAFLFPLAHSCNLKGTKMDSLPFTKWHMREVWMFDAKTISALWTMVEGARDVVLRADEVLEGQRPVVRNGLLLRRLHNQGGTMSCVAAIAIAILGTSTVLDALSCSLLCEWTSSLQATRSFSEYLLFLESTGQATAGLPSCAWEVEPFFKAVCSARPRVVYKNPQGGALIKLLALKQGKDVGFFLDTQLKWMIAHPSGSPDECKAALLDELVKRS